MYHIVTMNCGYPHNFHKPWFSLTHPELTNPQIEPPKKSVTGHPGRYMMGQCILLARFNFLPETLGPGIDSHWMVEVYGVKLG